MRRLRAGLLAVSIAVAMSAAGCNTAPSSPGGGIVCTAQFVYGLAVTVKDAATGQQVCDAQVTAVSGAYRETLITFGPPDACSYAGAGERAGVYDVSASKTGYLPVIRTGVRVDADVCHVIPVRINIDLTR